jgi:HlyD family secretion protein
MNKTVKWILIGVGALILILVIVRLMEGSKTTGVKVTAETVTKRTIVETVNASGKVYPEVEVKVSSDISGEITQLTVQEGDSVRKGQMLARIYADVYSSQRDEAAARVTQSQATVGNSQASLQALKAQLDLDRAAYNRNKQLYDDKVISKAEFEQYETKLQSSQAQYNAALQNIRSLQAGVQSAYTGLQMANKNLSRATIVAPMSGVISQLNVKLGERVVGTAQMAGTEMMRVANMNSIEVRVDVGENDIVKVKVGDSADVKVEAYNDRKFKGIVTQIASSTNKTGAAAVTSANDVTNYEVHIRLDPSSYADIMAKNPALRIPFRPGMNASADIKTQRRDNVVAVPITAVAARVKGSDKNIEDKKKEKKKQSTTEDENGDTVAEVASDELEEVVFVINKDNKVAKRIVKTGIQDINFIEILSGLQPGDKVVTAPYNAIRKTLKSGKEVDVVKIDQLIE